jgi:tetratricopeptide (TPR) repeat protein
MSIDRIKQLHEQASERYLSGDFDGALQAWRDVLGLDPGNEQALGGVRLASQFVARGSPAFATAAPEVEQELEQGLRVLDGLAATTLLHPDEADGASDRKPEPEGPGAEATEESLEGWETPSAPSEEGSFGLEPISRPSPSPAAPVSAAAAELRRRVADLLTEAKAKAEAGERDDALSILARLSILDEDNVEAEALRSKIEAAGASDLDKVERAIIEGVAALESDRLDDAERYFREALALAPEHREAQHYLEKVAERRTPGGEELLGAAGGESAPAEDAVQLAIGTPAVARKKVPAPPPPPSDPGASPPAASRPRFVLPPPKVLILGGVGAVALVCAAIALPHLFGGSAPQSTPPKASAPAPRPARAAKSGSAPKTAPAAPARVLPATPEERERAVASALATGRSLMASQDFGGAVFAFNEARALDPGNAAAKAGIADAGERYMTSKAERDALNTIKLAFRDGEFTSGLRLAYRLPPSVSTSYADGVKVVGWYNLAVVALRARDCREAMSHLDEVLEIAPSDAEAKKLREFASRYAEAVKDRVFLDRIEALSFRPLPSS